jgi:hypothetical protein
LEQEVAAMQLLWANQSARVMEIYKRNITTTLWALRIGFIAAILLGFYLIKTSHTDYAIVLFFLLVCGVIFPVTDLKISPGYFEVRQYHVYGIFRRVLKFDKNDSVRLEPSDLVISDAGVVHADDWYDAFWLAVPDKEITIKKYVLKYFNSWARLKRIKLTLSAEEVNTLKRSFPIVPMPITEASQNGS